MKCRKCKKPMQFLGEFEKITEQIIPSESDRAKALNRQIVICESCSQAYGYVERHGKLKLTLLTEKWIMRQTPQIQKEILRAVNDLKRGLKQLMLIREWMRRLSDED